MPEPTQIPQAPATDRREAAKSKLAGQTCITLFVVFLISLLAFGKAPLSKVTGPRGYSVNSDLISCLGVAMGAFAVIFLLTSLKRVLRLSTAKKALGMVGASGLIAHAIIAVFLPLSYGTPPPVGTGGSQPFAQSGTEEWTVEGRTVRIASTYYLRLPEGLQYTIEYPYRFTDLDSNMNDERALAVAWPLMKHAYASGAYKRATITKAGEGDLTPSRIGVALFEKAGANTRGYRVALSLEQIRKRIEESPAAPSTLPL